MLLKQIKIIINENFMNKSSKFWDISRDISNPNDVL